MGWLTRLHDFGDREMIKTIALRVDVGLRQLDQQMHENRDPHEVNGLASAVGDEVKRMQFLASTLTQESLNCLYVKHNGQKILYGSFIKTAQETSEKLVSKGYSSLLIQF